MADKYLIHGAAFCGDGTASNEAASAGAVGAWNDLAVFWNTNSTTATAPAYGTLSAGDNVYIRSKSSAGADVTVAIAVPVYWGSQLATDALPITWILDNGVTWPGVAGTLKFETSTSTARPNSRAYNRIIALTDDSLFFDYNVADPVSQTFFVANAGSYVKGLLIDNNEKNGGYQSYISCSSAIMENLHLKVGRLSNPVIGSNPIPGSYSGAILINPWIEMMYSAVPANNLGALFSIMQSSNRGGDLLVIGGKVTGVAAGQGYAKLFEFTGASSGHADFIGFDYPKAMPTMLMSAFPTHMTCHVNVIGADEGYGSSFNTVGGVIDSRNQTYNYPVLNATMPDSVATKWSWRCAPTTVTAFRAPLRIPISKFYANASAAKTITLEMLVADTFAAAALDRAEAWLEVTYVNAADNSTVRESTRLPVRGTALSTSTAGWNSTTWGPVALLKRKLELTTANSIKQNTLVNVNLIWCIPSVSADDIFFVCPDVQLS